MPKRPGTEPVHVEEGQGQEETIVGLPAPGPDQRADPGQQRGVGVHRALGPAGGARGVDDERVGLGTEARQIALVGMDRRRGGPFDQLVDGEDRDSTGHACTPVDVGEGEHRRAVRHEVLDLGRGGRRADGHEHGAGAQDTEQDLDRLEGGPGRPQDTRRPGVTPAAARAAATRAVASASAAPSTTRVGSQPSTRTGAVGRADQRADHTSGSVRPGGTSGPAGQRPGGTGALTKCLAGS